MVKLKVNEPCYKIEFDPDSGMPNFGKFIVLKENATSVRLQDCTSGAKISVPNRESESLYTDFIEAQDAAIAGRDRALSSLYQEYLEESREYVKDVSTALKDLK